MFLPSSTFAGDLNYGSSLTDTTQKVCNLAPAKVIKHFRTKIVSLKAHRVFIDPKFEGRVITELDHVELVGVDENGKEVANTKVG